MSTAEFEHIVIGLIAFHRFYNKEFQYNYESDLQMCSASALENKKRFLEQAKGCFLCKINASSLFFRKGTLLNNGTGSGLKKNNLLMALRVLKKFNWTKPARKDDEYKRNMEQHKVFNP